MSLDLNRPNVRTFRDMSTGESGNNSARQASQSQAKDYVLTGPPNSGKTTLIREIAAMGLPTLHEVATELLQQGISFLDQPAYFEEEKFRRQLRYEAGLPSERSAFLDRGLFDTVAYHQAYDTPLPDYITDTATPRYRMCFLLAPCPWTENNIRYEASGDLHKAAKFSSLIAPLLEHAYKERGVPVIRVPVMPVERRLRFILDHCENV